ncbi:MAG: LysR family transcriptional regulator [Hyphomicrobiaceae bacterium]|nr:LysR family transcriptional regulator [Hyphomicrobiaceae bacterium]
MVMRSYNFPGVYVPNIRHADLCVSVAELGSLTAAAERKNISQPAASQAIAGLEVQFGGQIFERTNGKLSLTPRGEVVHLRFVRGLKLLALCDEAFRSHRSGNGKEPANFLRCATSANLRAIVAVTLTGSFSAAAIALGRSEPAVNKSIHKLEALMGVQLFDRHPGGTVATYLGRIVARLSGRALKEFCGALDEVLELDGRFEGTIAIGASPVARSRILPNAIMDLLRRHPRANFTVRDGSQSDLIWELQLGSVDIVVGAVEKTDLGAGLDYRVLFADQLSVVAGAMHPLSGKKDIEASELLGFPWILPPKGTATREVMERAWLGAGMSMPAFGTIETDSMELIRAVLMASNCLTVLSEPHLSRETDPNWVRRLNFELAGGRRKIGLITRAGWRPTRLQGDFVKVLNDAVEWTFSEPEVADGR